MFEITIHSITAATQRESFLFADKETVGQRSYALVRGAPERERPGGSTPTALTVGGLCVSRTDAERHALILSAAYSCTSSESEACSRVRIKTTDSETDVWRNETFHTSCKSGVPVLAQAQGAAISGSLPLGCEGPSSGSSLAETMGFTVSSHKT